MTANLNNYNKITKYIAELSRKGYTFKEILEAVMKYEPDEANELNHPKKKKLSDYISNK